MKWFKDRLGTEPMDKGAVAMDFDEVFCFKSLPMWWKAVGPRPALNLTTALGLGLAIDYSLLMLGRYREELASGAEPAEAIIRGEIADYYEGEE